MLTIGIDLGTSAVKLLLMDEKGKILNVVSREYPLIFPQPGWSEQDPDAWIRETMTGIAQLTEGFDKTQIVGIGAGGQMHGLVVLDEDDKVIRPAILWNDGRTYKEVDYLNQQIGKDKLSDYTANIAFAGFTAPKLLWMRNQEPENFARIRKIMLPKDYVNYRLSGVHCTDYSDASGMLLLDVKNKCWSKEMLDICGVSEAQMPKLFESYEPVGQILPEVAAKLGLPDTVLVAAGAGDNAAAAVGTGTVGDGSCNISLGTSGTIFISSEKFGVDENNALHSFVHADGQYHLMGVVLSAASCNKWWMEEILKTGDFVEEQKEIDPEKLGRNHVYFLPTQAVLEGVAFAIRDSLEVARAIGIDIKKSTICGGGAKSPLWRTIFANICNIEIESIAAEEGPGYGGAMLAMVACGVYPSVEDIAESFVKVVRVEKPDPELSARYEDRYQRFREIYPSVKALFPKLNG